MNSVALQCFLHHVGELVQRSAQRVVEFVAGDPQIRAAPRQFSRERGDRAGGQLLLGDAALRPQPAERADRRGPGQIDGACLRETVDHVLQQRLVDQVAGQVRMAHGRSQRGGGPRHVEQGQVGAGAAEIAQCDDTPGGHAGVPGECGERGLGVGDHGRGRAGPGELRRPGQGGAQCLDRPGTPVAGVADGDRAGGPACLHGVQQRPQGLHHERFGPVRGSVGGHDADRVADPIDEIGEDQAALGEVRILRWHTYFRWPVGIARQHRRA